MMVLHVHLSIPFLQNWFDICVRAEFTIEMELNKSAPRNTG